MHMDKMQIKTRIRNDWPLYLAVIVVILVMRHFGRTSDTDTLKWILAPTARWAGILGGISFEYLPHQGYVNHGYQFLIAASCAGIRFMLLTFLMLVFLPVHENSCQRKGVRQGRCVQIVYNLALSYFFTVFVNGVRIVLAVRLPILLDKLHLWAGWLTPDRLHTLIGTVTYFTALCVLYLIITSTTERNRLLVPVFWYLLIVLALPFAKRVWYREWTGFGEYALLIIGVCMAVCFVFWGISRSVDRG